MKIFNFPQGSPEWHELKRGNIGGTRFGAVISGKKNQLVYELLNERLSPWMEPVDLSFSEDVQFGIDNEPVPELYSKQTGYPIWGSRSDNIWLLRHSPPQPGRHYSGQVNSAWNKIYQERPQTPWSGSLRAWIKNTYHSYNAFAVSDEVKEVHWISFCPDRFERPIVAFILKREMFKVQIESGRTNIKRLEADINKMESEFTFWSHETDTEVI